MKKICRILLPCISVMGIFHTIRAQNTDTGEILKVFSNFHIGLTEDDRSTAFAVDRVYLGYKHDIDDQFTAEVKLDIGSPDDLSQYSLIKRYAYFKNAAFTFHRNKIKAWFGLFDMQQFKVQEDFWGYRYIYKSFQDDYKFGPSADIGAGAAYSFNDYIEADLVVSNGEGYKNLQTDNSYKTGVGVTLHPEVMSLSGYIMILTIRILHRAPMHSLPGITPGNTGLVQNTIFRKFCLCRRTQPVWVFLLRNLRF